MMRASPNSGLSLFVTRQAVGTQVVRGSFQYIDAASQGK